MFAIVAGFFLMIVQVWEPSMPLFATHGVFLGGAHAARERWR